MELCAGIKDYCCCHDYGANHASYPEFAVTVGIKTAHTDFAEHYSDSDRYHSATGLYHVGKYWTDKSERDKQCNLREEVQYSIRCAVFEPFKGEFPLLE